jgi:SsrA-binding protein
MSGGDDAQKVIATNRRARHEYEVLERIEAGLVLVGPEVKSLRDGKASLTDAYASFRRGEAWLHHLHISPYPQAGRENPDPKRDRKLLLHRKEIARLEGRVAERGLTLVPLSLYFRDGRAKVEIALAKGKKDYDKRQTLREKQDRRESDRAIAAAKRRQRGE